MDHSKLIDEIEDTIIREFSRSYDETKKFHSSMVEEITSTAGKSPVYSGIKKITDISQLNELPLTTYGYVQECFDRLGVENVLLTPSVKFWHTSGSTGKPKKVYYGQKDLDEITLSLFQLLYICGARPWNNAWVFTASGGETLFGPVVDRYKLDGIITPLTGELDLIKALRTVSKLEKIDVLVGVTWLYLLMHKIVNNPKEFEALVFRAVKQKVKVPGIAWLFYKYVVHGINYKNLAQTLSNVKLGFSHAEALSPYLARIKEAYPHIEMHDVFGATEQWVQAIQVSNSQNWLSFFLKCSIPELAPPEEILKAKQDRNYLVKAVPWCEWKKGMRGELILTRPNECLPLIRYPTGDLIEVMDPAYKFTVKLEKSTLEITLPAIKALGRAADSVDFEATDESGNFLGYKVYSRQVNDALLSIKNVRWWELYHVKGSPGKFVFLIIPEKTVLDEASFRSEISNSLVNMFEEFTTAVQARAFLVGGNSSLNDQSKYLEIIITRPSAYDIIDREIQRRIREGRTIGQLKPKRIYLVENEEDLRKMTAEKAQA